MIEYNDSALLAFCEEAEASNRKQIHKSRLVYDHQNFPTVVSIGVVEIADSDNNIEEVFKAFDSACFIAYERGNLVYACRTTEQHITMCESQARWVSWLHTALEEDLFTLHAQPIIPLNTRKFYTAHYEWLRRLKDDDQTLIYPDTFLSAAARYNLLPAINRRYLERLLTG